MLPLLTDLHAQVSAAKLRHDVQQLRFLKANGIEHDSDQWAAVVDAYKGSLQALVQSGIARDEDVMVRRKLQGVPKCLCLI